MPASVVLQVMYLRSGLSAHASSASNSVYGFRHLLTQEMIRFWFTFCPPWKPRRYRV